MNIINWIKTSIQVIFSYNFLDINEISVKDVVRLNDDINIWRVCSIDSDNVMIERFDQQNTYFSKIVSLSELTKI